MFNAFHNYFLFLTVFFALLKLAADGAPLLPGLRILSPEPFFILFLFACMFAYNPFLVAISI